MGFNRRYNLFTKRIQINDEVRPHEWAEDGFVFYRGGWCQGIDVFKASRRVYLDDFVDSCLKVYGGDKPKSEDKDSKS